MGRVLIVDDDESCREILCEAVEGAGHTYVEAANVEEALASCREQPFDLVITDIVMPGGSGHDLIQQLRGEFPATRIIAVAAMGELVLARARQLGVDRAFGKPFRLPELLRAVEDLIG